MMTHDIQAGAQAPDFSLPTTEGDRSLGGMLAAGRRLVLAFYIEDGTPSCESELGMLRDSYEMLREFSAGILAVSADSIESHRAFLERIGGLPFPLASDADLFVAKTYDVVDEGDPHRSRRAVFVIDHDRKVVLAISHFQPANLSHVEAIFAVLGAEV